LIGSIVFTLVNCNKTEVGKHNSGVPIIACRFVQLKRTSKEILCLFQVTLQVGKCSRARHGTSLQLCFCFDCSRDGSA